MRAQRHVNDGITLPLMNVRALLQRALARLPQEIKRAELEVRRRRTTGDLFIDYGWIRLLFSGESDRQEISYHLNQARWYEKEMNVYRSLIAPGQTAVDVGANIGFVTTMLARIVGPSGRILSFEPSPTVFPRLQKTIKANGLANVTALNLGCGASPSIERLHEMSGSSGNASILGDSEVSTKIRVERLDDIPEVWESAVSLLKIDAEGYEPKVLEGAHRVLEEHRPIIYLEMGGDYVSSTVRTVELLTEAGYRTDHVRSIDWSSVGNGNDYFFFPRT
jgi:FkbM family methyltransferase